MYIRNRSVALIYRLLLITCCLYGLYLITGLSRGAYSPTLLAYYTIQSNLLVLALFAVLAVKTAREWRARGARETTTASPTVKGAVTVAITVTLLVYHFMLVPRLFTMYPNYTPFSLSDVLVHYVTPLLTLGDWLLFDPKGRFRWRDPWTWLILPVAYFVYAVIRAQGLAEPYPAGSRYPYFFMDIDQLGWGVVPWLLGLLAGFAALGYALVGIDSTLARLGRRFRRGPHTADAPTWPRS